MSPTAAARDIAVVGAGPGGLAAALLLGARGLRVTVYESQDRVGGRTGRVTLRDGADSFHFDRGATFFLMPYVLGEVFAACGRRLEDHVTLTRLDPMYRLVVGGRGGEASTTLEATQDIAEMSRRLSALDARDGAAFERFMAENRAKLALMEPILRAPMRGWGDVLASASLKFLPHLKPLTSVAGLLEKRLRHPVSRLAMSFQSKYLGMSPYECPSLFTILPFIEYEYGIWHPQGGCHALMEAMARVCRELGVDIRCGSAVERVTFDGRRARGVVVNGVEHRHGQVVINADAAWALKTFIPERLRPKGYSDGAIDRKRYSCSTFMMYLGVEGAAELAHHTVYISGMYRENLDNISVHGRLSEDPSVYVCNPCVTDPGMSPAGCASLYVLMPTPNTRSRVDWRAESARLEGQCLEQLESKLGVRDIRKRVRVSRSWSAADWAGMNIQFGATFNLAHNLGQMLHRRPRNRMEGVDGVWLVGGGTHPGSGLPVIFLSSQSTARLMCEELGVGAWSGGTVRRDDADVRADESASASSARRALEEVAS